LLDDILSRQECNHEQCTCWWRNPFYCPEPIHCCSCNGARSPI